MARFLDSPAVRDGRRVVCDLSAHLPDLPGDPERRSRRAARRPHLDPGDPRGDPQGLGLRQADLRAVRDHYEEDLHRHRRLLLPADQRRRRDQARPARDPLAGDRRGGDLARLRDPLRGDQRGKGGEVHRHRPYRAGAGRRVDAGLPARRAGPLVIRVQGDDIPGRGIRAVNPGPLGVVQPSDPALVRAVCALHRLLFQGLALQHPRHDQ